MFSNSTPLNWHSTLRRLRKEGDMGQLGRDMGILPGRKTFTSQLMGMVTKHRPTQVISEAAAPLEKSVNKLHKVNKRLQKVVKKAGATKEDAPVPTDSTEIEGALEAIPPGPKHAETPPKAAKPPTPKPPTPTPATEENKEEEEEEDEAAAAYKRASARKKARSSVKKASSLSSRSGGTGGRTLSYGDEEGYVTASSGEEEGSPLRRTSKTPAPKTPKAPSTVKSATAAMLSTAVSPAIARAITKRAPISTPKSPDDPLERMEQGLQQRQAKPKTPKPSAKSPKKRKGVLHAIGDAIHTMFGKTHTEPLLPVIQPAKKTPKRTPKKGLNLVYKPPVQAVPEQPKVEQPKEQAEQPRALNEGVTRHGKNGTIFRKGGRIISAANAYKSGQ